MTRRDPGGGTTPFRPGRRGWRPAPCRRPRLLLAATLLAAPLATGDAAAQDEPIELADDPFEITDPIAARPGEAELAIVGFYERARRGRWRGTTGTEAEVEVGVAPNLEFRVGQAGAYGNLETRRRLDAVGEDEPGARPLWGGTTRIGALYQVASGRGGTMPAIGLLGRVQAIYGSGRPGYEAEVVALIGKTLRTGALPLGVHLNLGLVTRFDPLPGERQNRLFFNLSVGQAVTHDTALVLSYAQEQQERDQEDFRLLQAGLRHRLAGTGTVLGLAFGAGIGRDSPRFQVAFAVGWPLSLGGR